MNRVLFPALLGLLLTACASTSTVRSMNVRPLAVQDIDLKGCGMTLTQPAGGTFFVADAQGASSRQGVYAGGDIVTGAATVISAMGAGKLAAKAICASKK